MSKFNQVNIKKIILFYKNKKILLTRIDSMTQALFGVGLEASFDNHDKKKKKKKEEKKEVTNRFYNIGIN